MLVASGQGSLPGLASVPASADLGLSWLLLRASLPASHRLVYRGRPFRCQDQMDAQKITLPNGVLRYWEVFV